MIKEIFEIEPKQKNLLIILFAIACLSFLQIYLFSPATIDKGVFVVVGLSLGLTVCWAVLYAFPLIAFYFYFVSAEGETEEEEYTIKRIFGIGFLGIAWIIALTYIAYEVNLTFLNFIRISIAFSFLRLIFWRIMFEFRRRKAKKRKTE